jgi:K+-transporting ATPase A subunit
MTNITKRRTNRIESQLGIACLFAVCLMTASVPSSLAKKGAFQTQEGSASIPAGTTLNVRMIDELDTGKNTEGGFFSSVLGSPRCSWWPNLGPERCSCPWHGD